MVTDIFGALLQELGKKLYIDDLHEDENRSCKIRLPNNIEIQLEVDRSGQFLVMGSDLGLPPVGRFRVDLFIAALKANGLPHPLHGILAYSTKNEHLVMFERLPFIELTGDQVFAEFKAFSDKAKIWTDAIAHNEVPSISGYTSSHGSGMFGLMR